MGTVANEAMRTYGVTNKKDLVEMYPIGSIYITTGDTSPAALFGGTWELVEGRTLIGAGTVTDDNSLSQAFTLGVMGGELKHTLTVSELPSHTHDVGGSGWSGGSTGYINYSNKQNQYQIVTQATGSDQAHNNLPPYLVVKIWKRIDPTS